MAYMAEIGLEREDGAGKGAQFFSFSALLVTLCVICCASARPAWAELSRTGHALPEYAHSANHLAGPWTLSLEPRERVLSVRLSDFPDLASGHRFDPQFLPRIVAFEEDVPQGTIIIDTAQRFLYLIGKNRTARRYGVAVGRQGLQWKGRLPVTRKAEWPDWYPTPAMRRRQPELPVRMAGGPGNPLGARALYLGHTLYRIHGSNKPQSIGRAASSGCIRMRNEDVIDLYRRVDVNTMVIVR